MIERDFKDHKEHVEMEIEKARQAKKKKKKEKKTLNLEVAAMDEDCQSQTKRREEIAAEFHEMTDAIDQLRDAIDEVNTQSLHVDLKINQLVNERLRLEAELQKYRKLGKQHKAQP